jgi:hypothetical protein
MEKRMERTAYEPQRFPLQLMFDFWFSKTVWAAVRLGVADAIQDEPVAIAALAARTNCQPEPLRRLMRALAAHGVFAFTDDEHVEHSPLSRSLRAAPQGGGAMINSVLGDFHYDGWGKLDEAVRTGRPAPELLYGRPIFDWMTDHPEQALRFADAMSAKTMADEDALLGAWDPGPFRLAVDVGGSLGSLLRRLLARRQDARGIVFDRAEIVAAGPAAVAGEVVAERIEWKAGDFFQEVPKGGDLYLLKHILHDWDDAACCTILDRVAEAAARNGRLVIVEMLLPATLEPNFAWLLDINMMGMLTGRERTEEEYRSLLRQGGFEVVSVTPTAGPMSVIEAKRL